jgi:nucleotide-binding universal stress UspA family protein
VSDAICHLRGQYPPSLALSPGPKVTTWSKALRVGPRTLALAPGGDEDGVGNQESTVFSSVVIAVDLSTAADRALPVAGALARRGGLPIELLTVVPSGAAAVRPDELDERVRSLGLGPHQSVVVEDDDPGAAIVDHVRGRDGALLVLATTAKAALDESHGGSVSEHVLAAADQPVLLVGPRVDVGRSRSAPSLVVAVDASDLAAAALPVVVSWVRTFGGGPVTAAQVIPLVPAIAEQAGPALEARHVRRYADRLGELGVTAGGTVIHGGDPVAGLIEAVGGVADPVLVVTAERWPDAGTHWRSTSRKLAFRSPCPVLVVPATGG